MEDTRKLPGSHHGVKSVEGLRFLLRMSEMSGCSELAITFPIRLFNLPVAGYRFM